MKNKNRIKSETGRGRWAAASSEEGNGVCGKEQATATAPKGPQAPSRGILKATTSWHCGLAVVPAQVTLGVPTIEQKPLINKRKHPKAGFVLSIPGDSGRTWDALVWSRSSSVPRSH